MNPDPVTEIIFALYLIMYATIFLVIASIVEGIDFLRQKRKGRRQ